VRRRAERAARRGAAQKLLFCESEAARGSMARQLEPSLHVDSSPTVRRPTRRSPRVPFGTTRPRRALTRAAAHPQVLAALRPFVPSLVGVKTPANALALPAGPQVDSLKDHFEQDHFEQPAPPPPDARAP
jgi:hypothetical protein